MTCCSWTSERATSRTTRICPRTTRCPASRDSPHYYTVTLRWGRHQYPDAFAIGRHPEPDRAAESAFIHPVIRRYHGTELVAEQHLLEDLLAEWTRPDRHVDPLRAFFTRNLPSTAP